MNITTVAGVEATTTSENFETSTPALPGAEVARAPFGGCYDYLATLERLTVGAVEAQDGRAVRIFQRFSEAATFRGFAALFPRPYDPGESPLAGGPLLDDPHSKDEAFELYERVLDAANTPPADADARWREQADFFVGVAFVLWNCFLDSDHAMAVREEAFATAWQSLDNAIEPYAKFQRARADLAWADYRVKREIGTANVIAESDDVEAEHCSAVISRLERARRQQDRAQRRVNRAWVAVRMHDFRAAPVSLHNTVVWRMTGRAPRLRTNHRTGGSRRSTASRGDPDLGDEPPSHSPSLIGGGR